MSREKNRSWGGLRSLQPRRGSNSPPSPEQRFFSKTQSTGVAELQRHHTTSSSDDGSALPPGSPGTPPKKIWEQKYRSFLHRKQRSNNDDNNSLASTSSASLDTRTLIPPKNAAGHKNGFYHNDFATTPPPAALEPPLGVRGSGGGHHRRVGSNDSKNSRSSSLLLHGNSSHSSSTRTGGEDSSVRGGKLFSQLFRRDSSHKSLSNLSTDELDGTLRRGVDKATYSPKTTLPQQQLVVPPPPKPMGNVRSVSCGTPNQKESLYRVSTTGHSLSPSSVQIHEPTTEWDISNARAWSLSESAARGGGGGGDFASIPVTLVVSEPSLPLASSATTAMVEQRSALPRALEGPDTTSTTENDNDNVAGQDELDLSSRKKAFTEFHNSLDSDSPFLGDDSSHFHFQTAALYSQMTRKTFGGAEKQHMSHNELSPLERCASTKLEPVPENIAITKQRMLRPFVGVEKWKAGRRYLIAPAVLAASPLDASSSSSSVILGVDACKPLTARQAASSSSTGSSGPIVLGNCLLSYTLTGNASITAKTWSRGSLVLRQNYLLEYDEIFEPQDDSSKENGGGGEQKPQPLYNKGEPRGYAHLEGAVARPHPDFADALELDFFGSPCSKSDMRKLVIRLTERSERDSWVACLNQAANFDVSCLYDIDSSHGLLGEGHYSTVHKATVRDSNEVVALKIFDKSAFWKLVVKGRERADTLVRETSVQATLTAKCLGVAPFLRLRGFLETSSQVVLELELLGGTDLFRYISSKDGVIPESEAAQILSDVLTCLVTMNKCGVAHRDIKPSNLLMCDDGGTDSPRVKVCDFGMSTFVGVDGHIRGRCGTPGYVAPEIFTTGLHGGYGNKVDVYSAGVTLYVMLCSYEPFYGESDEELVEANRQSRVEFPKEEWKKVSKEARDLVEKLMAKDPEKRPSAKEALEHAWFKTQLGV